MLWFGLAVEAAVGLLCIALGLIVWKKQKITLVHDYHHRHVKKEDVPAYTRLIGIGLIVMGVGILICGAVNWFTDSSWGFAPLAAGFAFGFWLMHKAQKTYNGSWFS